MKNIFFFSFYFLNLLSAQKLKKSDKDIIENLRIMKLAYLASDQLEGRRTGTPGEKLAYEYLSDAI